uniref:Reverse transcriptase domain-containing protein n=1 Tax=Megaselia scalaris TaxID=36166 RepID=T1GZR2_MEGSC
RSGIDLFDAFQQILVKIICPIPQKGDKKGCNYQGISLFNIGYKILISILCETLKPRVIKIVGSYQCGLMRLCDFIAYSDNIDLIGRSSVNMVEFFLRLERAAGKRRQNKIHDFIPKHTAKELIMTMDSYNIDVVKNFVYLGSGVTSNNNFLFHFRKKNPFVNLRSYLRKRGVENKVQPRAKTTVPKSRRCPKDQS